MPQAHAQLTLKMGSRISWQNVRGSFLPSGLVADLLNLPLAGSKYLADRANPTRLEGLGRPRWVIKTKLGRTPQILCSLEPYRHQRVPTHSVGSL